MLTTDGALQTMIDRKFEPLVRRLLTKYLGELEDDDLLMFVLEHLKDHKSPAALVEETEAVRLYLFHFQGIVFM
jgi:RNA-binding protein 25